MDKNRHLIPFYKSVLYNCEYLGSNLNQALQ